MNIIIASDSFKGSCSSQQVAEAVESGILSVSSNHHIAKVLIADGGEGTMKTLTQALSGNFVSIPAHDALMRPILSVYGLLSDNTAILDMAETAGITRLNKSELNPIDATTYGLGEQMADAYSRGCRKFLIGLGGSATTDGGMGMIQALKDNSVTIEDCDIQVLCDVTNPLFGPNGAAYIFAPQKGANPQQICFLDNRLQQIAADSPHPEFANNPGAGAAGGLGFALMAYLGAKLVSGIDTILAFQHFDDLLANADLVITGEGKMDAQTLMNKAPFGVLSHAKKVGIKTIGIAGKIDNHDTLLQAGFAALYGINKPNTPLDLAMQTAFAMERIKITAAKIMKEIINN